ncbi:PilT protein domain protein, partial [mine drainage metagenome]
GTFKSDRTGDVDLIDSLGKDLVIINMSEDDAKLTAKMMAYLDNIGAHVEVNDVLIASICINRGMSLLTDNIKHFSRMEQFGLVVQSTKETKT